MRRLLSASIPLLVVIASCGDGAAKTSDTAAVNGTPTTVAAAVNGTPTTVAGASPAQATYTKPVVKIPAALPTKLVVTVLKEGTGEPSKNGDTVEVHYVGVRSVDGAEFDNSYDRGQTFPVELGRGGVIQGWQDGLIGVKVGSQIQLDIPAELAYGDNPRPGVIQPGDALTFVIDVVSVVVGVAPVEVPVADAADEPVASIPTSEGAAETTFTDLAVGSGAEATAGSTGYIQIIAYNGSTGEKLTSTWAEGGQAVEIPIDPTQQILPGLITGVSGMKIGGQRVITVPFNEAWGPDGNPGFGLPASTDVIFVVELVAVQPAA